MACRLAPKVGEKPSIIGGNELSYPLGSRSRPKLGQYLYGFIWRVTTRQKEVVSGTIHIVAGIPRSFGFTMRDPANTQHR